MTPIAVTIAGSDSGGGAGIQADLKTFSALGVYGASVITALTAQNTLGVQGIFPVDPDFIGQQIDSVYSDLAVSATKIGMVAQVGVIKAIVAGIHRHKIRPLVFDPVMVATSGDLLLQEDAIEALTKTLLPLAQIITPNLHEAAALLGGAMARSEEEMREQGEALLRLGARAVLMKGGHGDSAESVDLLVQKSGITRFAAPRIKTQNTHGTGCTLSSAIAAGLAKGLDLVAAVDMAKIYVSSAIAASNRLSIGKGHGPTHHFHGFW